VEGQREEVAGARRGVRVLQCAEEVQKYSLPSTVGGEERDEGLGERKPRRVILDQESIKGLLLSPVSPKAESCKVKVHALQSIPSFFPSPSSELHLGKQRVNS
jgi:hypothetical protein